MIGARWGLAVLGAALVASCGASEAGVPTTVAVPVVSTVPPTTTGAQATTTAPAPSSTTTAVAGQVGDPEALRELGERIRATAVEFGYTQFEGVDIPYPDLSDPDPTVALREALAFEAWLLETGPHPSFAELYNYVEGPRRTEASTRFSGLLAGDRRYEGVVASYVVLRTEVVPLDRADIVAHERELLPEGSVAVAFTAHGGSEQIVDRTTGEVVEEVDPYDDEGIVILSPTDLGWQLFWEGDGR